MDIYNNREKIEWSNTWIENCNVKDIEHWLLIGDSVARGFRSNLSRLLKNKSVDFIGTSSLFEDPCFYNIFNAFFEKNIYKYSKILIMIGGKHGYYLDTYDNKQDNIKYKQLFSDFLNYISLHCKDITILLNTPSKQENNIEEWDKKINYEILNRNTIQTEVAKEKQYNVIDLYNLVYQNNYKYLDNCHFASDVSNDCIAKYIFDTIYNYKKEISTYKNLTQEETSNLTAYNYSLLGIRFGFNRKRLLDNIDKFLLTFCKKNQNIVNLKKNKKGCIQ